MLVNREAERELAPYFHSLHSRNCCQGPTALSLVEVEVKGTEQVTGHASIALYGPGFDGKALGCAGGQGRELQIYAFAMERCLHADKKDRNAKRFHYFRVMEPVRGPPLGYLDKCKGNRGSGP